ncbi:MAG: hypothetical protein KUF77_15850 [Candidatus Thiodiazotropha sp. (ex Lucina aurantia)]|nr:hypothetical protein [Candidatus Thiodiazotropha sp. (ex Lucina pensylvanica)]MBV2100770.1 hypothetical protein [Candidatus Thiodiazotropha sp. (ex Codakia orbicularis)]MBV2104499.1 hypothetical protein [Candidatus Thiodiazotropha sp. (ex Lucina aurantia)]MBV2119058.1 hypothetical protein [Candidatus Thiodiazotropha sp. (ex Lucina aurantia)]
MKLDIEALIKKAAEASKHAPEHLQEAAFNKAFDALMGENQGGGHALDERGSSSTKKSRTKKKTNKKNTEDTVSIDTLDRTQHPEIHHNSTALNNSLRLLRAAKDDLGIDGVTAASIANVLVDKFRCRITRQAVSMALNDAGRYVNRHKEGNLVIFRIMAPGEDYLDSLEEPDSKGDATQKKKKGKKTAKSTSGKKKSSSKKKSKKGTSGGKTGPATAMSDLYDKGYFSTSRTIADIIDKLKHDAGRTFKANELSPVLLRWLRSGKLNRKQNSESQYEYKQQ